MLRGWKTKYLQYFKSINVHYLFKGELEDKKIKHAIELSMEKYCSVTAILNKTAKIDYSFTIEK